MEGWQRDFVLYARPAPTAKPACFWTFSPSIKDGYVFWTRARVRAAPRLKACCSRLRRCWLAGGGRSEIKTLRSAEPVSLGLPLIGLMLYSGLYINELLSRVLAYETDYSTLFYNYLQCLQWLAGATGSPEPALRRFELALQTHLGYGVDFLHCACSGEPVDDAMTYRYREEKGFIASVLLDRYSFSGCELHALAAREFPDVDTLCAAKRFTRMAQNPIWAANR